MSHRCGIFGKLPAHGDFICRQLPTDFTSPWDAWLSACMADSQERLGDHWLELYLSSPIWRFAVSSGCINQQGWVGIIMPSVDSVGRYFPLTLAAPLSHSTAVFLAQSSLTDWFQRVEETALSALEQGIPVDHLLELLHPITLPEPLPTPLRPLQAGGWVSTGETSAHHAMGVGQLLDSFTRTHYPSFSVWWSETAQHLPATTLQSVGLPSVEQFSALLTGQWDGL